MTQQLSMERAELERAKVRLAGISRCFSHESDHGCTAACGGGELGAGLQHPSSALCLAGPTPGCTMNCDQTNPLAHRCKRLQFVCMMHASS